MDCLYINKSIANEKDLCNLVFVDDLDKKCFLRQYYKDFSNLQKGRYSKLWQ